MAQEKKPQEKSILHAALRFKDAASKARTSNGTLLASEKLLGPMGNPIIVNTFQAKMTRADKRQIAHTEKWHNDIAAHIQKHPNLNHAVSN